MSYEIFALLERIDNSRCSICVEPLGPIIVQPLLAEVMNLEGTRVYVTLGLEVFMEHRVSFEWGHRINLDNRCLYNFSPLRSISGCLQINCIVGLFLIDFLEDESAVVVD